MKILVFSSAPDARERLVPYLQSTHHDVRVVGTAAQAGTQLAGGSVALVIVDLGGPEALRFLRRHGVQHGPVATLCLADRRRPDVAAEALRLGALDIIGRPLQSEEVAAALANAREFSSLRSSADDPVDLEEQPNGVFGTSAAMRDVLGIVRRVAPSRCGVLIVGEQGTGREMVARAIHAHGPRHERPLIKIVCADGGSLEFERVLNGKTSPGSTIYLEDIGSLVPEIQLQLEAAIGRSADSFRSGPAVDGCCECEAPPRFIASAQPRLFESAMRGSVRRGLIESLAVVRIDLAPLRQRAQDIPLLAMHFLKEACSRADTPPKTFAPSALKLLAALPWPGNAAELRSLTERLTILVPRGVILLEDVLANVRFDHAKTLGRPRQSLREAREQFERDYITSVLDHHRGRIAEAARDLGLERTNLYRKIRQHNIRRVLPA